MHRKVPLNNINCLSVLDVSEEGQRMLAVTLSTDDYDS